MPREIDEAWIDEAIERYRRLDVLRGEFEKAVAGHLDALWDMVGRGVVLELISTKIHPSKQRPRHLSFPSLSFFLLPFIPWTGASFCRVDFLNRVVQS
jgi:hypothetical protein